MFVTEFPRNNLIRHLCKNSVKFEFSEMRILNMFVWFTLFENSKPENYSYDAKEETNR